MNRILHDVVGDKGSDNTKSQVSLKTKTFLIWNMILQREFKK